MNTKPTNVANLNNSRVDIRYCPECGRAQTQRSIELLMIDPLCPSCNKKRYSEYLPTKLKRAMK